MNCFRRLMVASISTRLMMKKKRKMKKKMTKKKKKRDWREREEAHMTVT